jgi:hypothetical protein
MMGGTAFSCCGSRVTMRGVAPDYFKSVPARRSAARRMKTGLER